tara:strand:- start:42242 stop:42436 length:195 start_codon:yes stop_codon:yes gene_type:complete
MANMFGSKVSKNYKSEFDTFFHEFDKNRETMPESRVKEVEKYKAIFEKRDKAVDANEKNIWEDF